MSFVVLDPFTIPNLTVNDDTILGNDCATDTLTVEAVANFLCDVDIGGGGLVVDVSSGEVDIGDDLDVHGGLGVLGDTILGDNLPTACSDTLTVRSLSFFDCDVTLGDAAADLLTFNGTIVPFVGNSHMLFDGSTPGGFTTTFDITDPTGANIITFPDATGEVSLLGQTIGTAEIEAGAVTASELKYTVVAVTVLAAAVAGSSAADGNLSLGEILGFYPTGNQDQFVDSVVLNADGSVTITLAAAATVANTFNVVVMWP